MKSIRIYSAFIVTVSCMLFFSIGRISLVAADESLKRGNIQSEKTANVSLDEIRFPRVQFRDAHIDDVIDFITHELRRLHNETDLNIYVAVQDADVVGDRATKRVTLALKNVSLIEILNAVTSQLRVNYSVSDNMIVIHDSKKSQVEDEEYTSTTEKVNTLNAGKYKRHIKVCFPVSRKSEGMLVIDKSIQQLDSRRWVLSFQVVYDVDRRWKHDDDGGVVDDLVCWVIPLKTNLEAGTSLDLQFQVHRREDGWGVADNFPEKGEKKGFVP